MRDDDAPSAWETAIKAHEDSLVVGARVRVRLHGECMVEWPDVKVTGHPTEFHEAIGVIFDPTTTFVHSSHATHAYAVRFDDEILVTTEGWPSRRWGSGWFTAAELVLIDADGAPEL